MGRRIKTNIAVSSEQTPGRKEGTKVTNAQLDSDMDEIEILIKQVWKSMVVSEARSILSGKSKGHVVAQGTYSATSENYNVKVGFNIDRFDWDYMNHSRRKNDNSIHIRISPSKNKKIVKHKYWSDVTTKDDSFVSLRMNTPVLDDSKLKDIVKLAKVVMKGVQK